MICDQDPLRRRPGKSTARRKRQERCVRMARKMTEWPSKRGPISKIRPSDGCGRDAVLLAVERWYDFPEFGGYLGNVGLSLPRLMGTTVENIPASVPYLHVKNDVEPENPTISSNTRRIGIAWAGDPTHGNDKNRSCDLRTFLPLMSLPKTRFYSLQVGDRSVDIETHGWCPLLTDQSRNTQFRRHGAIGIEA